LATERKSVTANSITDLKMKSIAFLTEHAVVDRIIDDLKLTFVADRPPPAQAAFQELLMAADPPVDDFS